MAEWTFALSGSPPAGVPFRQLTKADGRAITWRVDAAATAQFSIDGRSDEAAQIAELATDLIVFRDGVKVFRGRIGPSSDGIDATKHRCQFTALDYRALLAWRYVGADHGDYTDVDQGQIAWDLIHVTQTRPGGNWGITNGIGATSGQRRTRSRYDLGKPIGEAIGELGRVENGFEWEISPELALNRWYPTRGAANGVVLDWKGTIMSASRQFAPADFANAILATGSETTAAVLAATADIGTDPRGRWERGFAYPTITDQSTLDARAPWLLGETSTLRPEWRVTFAPRCWKGFAHVGIGDVVKFTVRSGRIAANGQHRVVELVASIDESGEETVQAGLISA